MICHKSSTIHRLIVALQFLFISSILIPPVSITAQDSVPSASGNYPTILTATLRTALDTTVSPCEDFDQYANGRWRAEQPMRAGPIDIFRDARWRTDAQLLAVLASAQSAVSTTTDPVIQLLGTFFTSCLATDSLPTFLPPTPSGVRATTRPLQCLSVVDQLLRPALSYAFVQQVMTPQVAIQTQQFLTTIQVAIRTQVAGLSWVDDSVKQHALRVLDTMSIHVRFTPEPIDYGDLRFDPTAYPANHAAIIKWTTAQVEQERIRVRKDTSAWNAVSSAVPYQLAAHAFRSLHRIEVTPMFFQPPFFDLTAEPAANYASLGMILGHETWHLLTPFFRWIDGEEGKRRASVLVANYRKFGDSGWGTVNEDFGDLGGILAAYAAWQGHGRNDAAVQIEGFAPDQRFFLYYARLWRGTDRTSSDGKHSGKRARINGVVMQIPAFAKAFGCHDGDAMVLSANERAQIF